ncbi:serine/threonine-protein kinase [Streptomyces sp. CB01881]|uniref:serine/threonine-protein kinase n=1 Tax=Streptomyces sp. CB01881 TaxID=2078691 RepID=UPI000CDC195C|nr:serine/threonine-protein kinase [Streptomyces sp. CB01881]AUY50196.1 serine/threonine protein kinase [Streptomyces sp. CB01881]TYC73589.1 serine/threonine protein kinase [Streptomyces sp. CB01881]
MQALGADDPRQVGGYRLLRRLGAGGMGRVYLGRTAGGRTVAVKVVRGELAEDAEFRARFRQEVAAARRVGGAWTAPVLDADTEGEHPWVATGYVAGPALGGAVREFGPLSEAATRALGVGLAEALEHVHGLGLVHRDVKPSNVLLTLDGPRLIDFGIARALDATSGFTRSGYVVGSPGFMSPEQANGLPAGAPSDVFSLGAVLAFAATGVHPFGEGVSVAVLLYRVLHEEPDLSGLAEPLRSVVLASLAKDPAARPTPRQLRDRLDADGGATVRLGRGGWLPPALAAAVGRSAVGLLDLEGDPEDGPAAPVGAPASPVSPAPPAAPVAPLGAPAGAPAEVPPLWTPTAGSGVPVGGGVPVGAGGQVGAGGPVGLGPWTGPLPLPEQRAQWVKERQAPRWAVAVVGVTAAVLAFVAFEFGLFDWSGSQDLATTPTTTAASTPAGTTGVTQPPPATTPPATTPSAAAASTAAKPGGPSVVPAVFLGTWSGEMTSEKGLPAGTTTLVIGPAAIGQENTTSRNAVTGLLSIACEGAWTLNSASPEKLVFTSRLVRSSIPGACTGGSNTETLTLQSDGTIRFTSADPPAGNPAGTMRRAG